MKPILYALTAVSLFSAAFAEETTQPPRDESVFMAGVGTIIVDKPHKGGDTDITAGPMLFYQKDRLVLSGIKVNYYLIYDDSWAVSLLGTPRFEGYDDNESRYLRGMHDRDATYEIGIQGSRKFNWGTISATFLTDVLGEHKGQEIQLTCRQTIRNVLAVKSLNLTPSIGVNWRSQQLNNYYYGVRSSEALVTRPEYHVGSSTGILAGLRVDYQLGQKWSLFSSVNVEWLGSEITDSPIVDEHTMTSLLFGAMYKF